MSSVIIIINRFVQRHKVVTPESRGAKWNRGLTTDLIFSRIRTPPPPRQRSVVMQLGRSTCCVFCHQYRTRLGGGGGGRNCTPGVKRREGTRAIVPAESSDLSSPPGLTMINPSPAIWPRRLQRERSRPRSIHTTNIIIFKHHTSSSDAAIRRGAGSNKSVFAWK